MLFSRAADVFTRVLHLGVRGHEQSNSLQFISINVRLTLVYGFACEMLLVYSSPSACLRLGRITLQLNKRVSHNHRACNSGPVVL